MDSNDYLFLVVAKITEPLQPVDRGAKYEDPLHALLQGFQGGRVNGGGSQLNAKFEIEFVEIELSLKDLDGALQLVRVTLDSLGAPAGSMLYFMRDGLPQTLPVALFDPAKVAATARRLISSFESLWEEQQSSEPIAVAAYEPEMMEWYQGVSRELSGVGFKAMADLKLAAKGELKSGAPPSNFSRKVLSNDATIRGDVFQVRAVTAGKANTCFVGMVTEFDNQTLLSTNNAVQKWNTPDCMVVERLPPDSPPAAVVATHRKRLDTFLREQPQRRIRFMHTLEDVLKSENRAHALSAAFKRRQDLPTVDKLQRLGSSPQFAEAVYQEMQRIRLAQAPVEPPPAC
jgi:hypothetical protein